MLVIVGVLGLFFVLCGGFFIISGKRKRRLSLVYEWVSLV